MSERMEASLTIDGRTVRFDPKDVIDISIPLNFNGSQPNAYGVSTATSEPCVSGELVGDTRQGGSCNFESYSFIPHCNGTHTECIGHITNERISVRSSLRDVLIPARLITVDPDRGSDTSETYSTAVEESDRLITKRKLESAGVVSAPGLALIVRTLPNDDRKLGRRYIDEVPAYFTNEAMQFIVECGIVHLVVDLPSIDRLYDEGKLSNHRIFWNVEQGSFERNPDTRVAATVTELIYVPNRVEDGDYLLNLQIAPFASDASPSRPILVPIQKN